MPFGMMVDLEVGVAAHRLRGRLGHRDDRGGAPKDPAVVGRDPVAPARVGKARVQGQHLRSAKQRQRPERQAEVARAVDVEHVELPVAERAVEVVGGARADGGLEEAAAAAEGARAADANHALLGVLGAGRAASSGGRSGSSPRRPGDRAGCADGARAPGCRPGWGSSSRRRCRRGGDALPGGRHAIASFDCRIMGRIAYIPGHLERRSPARRPRTPVDNAVGSPAALPGASPRSSTCVKRGSASRQNPLHSSRQVASHAASLGIRRNRLQTPAGVANDSANRSSAGGMSARGGNSR